MNKLGQMVTSSDGNKASMTATGVIASIITVLIIVARSFNLPITENEITLIVTQVGIVVSAGTIIFGVSRKIVNRIRD